ncbi:ATP-binding protein [Streptomyces endophyticus]|uniref:ATP-binding protein n=1 Tax=Streptomyces endophyticus TaxID=714166 RepID=A0ABU6FIV6_9ACTN|nr:ATP-binding protein [Streptomyces endophyticus]MEB8343987.1 ATP-binding protein [Streptomyces endophyticus]
MGEHGENGGENGRVGYEPHPLIGGRGAALRDLAVWRAGGAGAPRVVLLTGSPGCGSSRLLTGFLMLCDPGYRERIALERLDPATVPPPLPAPAVPSAAGRTPAQVLWLLADHYGFDVTRDAEVYEALGAGERVVVVPYVDQAGPVRAGRGPGRMLRELLLPLAGIESVRLLAEVPRESASVLVQALPAGTVQVIDLDAPEFLDVEGLALQAEVTLDPAFGAPDLPFTVDAGARRALASALAGRAASGGSGSRLTVQLATTGWLLAPEPAPRPDGVPGTPGEALDLHARRLGADPSVLRATLAPLALVEGAGLPLSLWAPLASALAGRDMAAEIADGMLLAGPFVQPVEEAAAEGEAQIALAHPALGGTIRAQLPDLAAAQLRLAQALLGQVPDQDWSRAARYVRDGIAGHALGAGQLPRLLTDPSLMAYADPVALRAAVEEVEADEASAARLPPPARTYLRTAPLLTRTQADPPLRAKLLAAAFDEDGLPEYAQALRARPEFAVQDGRPASVPSPTVPHPRPMETQP